MRRLIYNIHPLDSLAAPLSQAVRTRLPSTAHSSVASSTAPAQCVKVPLRSNPYTAQCAFVDDERAGGRATGVIRRRSGTSSLERLSEAATCELLVLATSEVPDRRRRVHRSSAFGSTDGGVAGKAHSDAHSNSREPADDAMTRLISYFLLAACPVGRCAGSRRPDSHLRTDDSRPF